MILPISNDCLHAFSEVVKVGSFSIAARRLHITQPALSLRIRQLEEATGQQLLRRNRKGISLTRAGQRLLEYVRLREIIDFEVLSTLVESSPVELKGEVRIAGHFSIINHFAIPTLAQFLRNNSQVQIEVVVREDDEVPGILERGECEIALLQRPIQREVYKSHYLGEESYVLIRSSRYTTRRNVLIDSDPSDVITDDFFKAQVPQKRLTEYVRSYMHNEAGILRAVELGLGQAVIAEREIRKTSKVEKVAGYRPLKLPSYLQYSSHAQRSQLLSSVIAQLIEGAKAAFK